MSYQAYLDAVESKTGRTPAELLAEPRGTRLHHHQSGQARRSRGSRTSTTSARGHAMALYGVLKNGATISDKHVDSGGTRSDPVHQAAAEREANR